MSRFDCLKCGAPLAPKSKLCTYCGARSDLDFGVGMRRTNKTSERQCPECDIVMHALTLSAEGAEADVDRCEQCFGIFFDVGELELLTHSMGKSQPHIDRDRLNQLLNEEAPRSDRKTSYVPCPICKTMMNRKGYGSLSGVVIDYCRDHGIWLEGGEYRQIINWINAGGRALDQQQQLESFEKARRRAEQRASSTSTHIPGGLEPSTTSRDHDIGNMVQSVIRFLFDVIIR